MADIAQPITPTPEAAPSFEANDFSDLISYTESDDTGGSPEAAAPTTPTQSEKVEKAPQQESQAPVAVPPAAPAVPQQQQPAPVAQPQQPVPQAPAAPPAPSAPAPQPAAPSQPQQPVAQQPTAQDMTQRRNAIIENLASRQFAIPAEDVPALLSNPEKFLPKFAANIAMSAFEMAVHVMGSQMPKIMDSHLQQRETYRTSEEKFFEKWPELKKPEYSQTLLWVANLRRQGFPQESLDESIQAIGTTAMAMLGLSRGAPSVPSPVPPPAPAPVAAPAHRPLTPSGASPAAPSQAQMSEWESLVNEFSRLE